MIFLNASEHLFHVRLGEVNQDGTAVGTVIRVVTLGQLVDQIPCGVIVQCVIGLDGAFARHHDGQFSPVFLYGHFLDLAGASDLDEGRRDRVGYL